MFLVQKSERMKDESECNDTYPHNNGRIRIIQDIDIRNTIKHL